MYGFAKVVGQDMVIDAADGDTIVDSAASGNITNSVDEETWAFVILIAVSASKWLFYTAHGSWETT